MLISLTQKARYGRVLNNLCIFMLGSALALHPTYDYISDYLIITRVFKLIYVKQATQFYQ